MQYTVIVSERQEGQWQAIAPAFSNCTAEAPTREAVLKKIQENLSAITSTLANPNAEVLQIEVPVNGSQNGYFKKSTEQDWPGFGMFKNDPWLNQIFDEIEQRRDATRTEE